MERQYNITRTNSDITHYGVKGMKWGVRRYMNADGSLTPAGKKRYGDDSVGRAKLAVKSAKKEYKKSFNKASNYSSLHPVSQFVGKKAKAESDRRWEDTIDKADNLNKAKSDYKQVKAERRANINKTYREINDRASLGERLIYNEATRKKAAKYVVDKNMSLDDAVKRANNDAKRNTAIILGVYGSIALASLYTTKR